MEVGGRSAVAPLRRALVRAPRTEELYGWASYGWVDEPDPERIAREHDAFRAILAEAGVDVVVGNEPVPGNPDAVYACDPAFVTDGGVLLLRPGKEARRGEPDALRVSLEEAGIPVAGAMEAPATAEGGDMTWLDEETLVVGRSYRTNDAGIEWLRENLPEVGIHAFDLPHLEGEGEVLHLLSLMSLLDRDLAVAHTRLLPVRLVSLLRDRGVKIVDVPGEELETQGPNVLALAPRVALALDGNPTTRKRMEAEGVDVRTYPGEELSMKGLGGPTCLTLPLLRTS